MGEGVNRLKNAVFSIANEEATKQTRQLMNGFGTVQTDGSIVMDNLPDEPFTSDEYIILNNVFMKTGSRVFCVPLSSSGVLVVVGSTD